MVIILKTVNKEHYTYLLQIQNHNLFQNLIIFIAILKRILAIIVLIDNKTCKIFIH